MGTCSSKSINDTIADPVKPEQIDTPATIVDATTDIAPTEMPANAEPEQSDASALAGNAIAPEGRVQMPGTAVSVVSGRRDHRALTLREAV